MGFKLKSGNKVSYKNLGSSPLKTKGIPVTKGRSSIDPNITVGEAKKKIEKQNKSI